MSLKEIASVSGKPGLYKVVKPTRTGLILETIDAQKKKVIANANSRVSLLKEISIYTTSDEGSVLLEDVFAIIKEKKGNEVEAITDESKLYDFIAEIIEDYDSERVYASDIKKLITWYNILSEHYPELIGKEEEKPSEKKKATKKKEKEA